MLHMIYGRTPKKVMSLINAISLALGLLINLPADAQGVKFQEGLTWKQLLKKAKEENKYIFVDCYTTWCGPCKAMDKEVYPDTSVGAILNDKFIAVKMQMDKTPKDNEAIQQSYQDAAFLADKYKVIMYPTYLFFSPNGTLVHKDHGLKQPPDFIAVVETALTPGRVYKDPFAEYDRLLSEYKNGEKNYSKLPYMVTKARDALQWGVADSLTKDYYKYLQKQPKRKIYTKENLEVIGNQITSSKDPFFHLFFPDGRKVNQVMGNIFYADNVVDRVIMLEDADPLLGKEGSETGVYHAEVANTPEPDWNKMFTTIKEKYDRKYAERNLLSAKIKWYGNYHRWPEWMAANIEKIEKFGVDTTNKLEDVDLNIVAWEIFMRSEDTSQINSAIRWMAGVARRNCCVPMGVKWDTYANLLHKAGRTDEALPWEQKAIQEAKDTNNKSDIKLFQATYQAMQSGLPTWAEHYAKIEKKATTE